jgi:hypothetical protein
MKRIACIVAVGMALLARPTGAQERLGTGAPEQQYRAGWTFTPTVGVAETYDSNVSLFSKEHIGNEDYIATVSSGADVHFTGKHSTVDMGYSGSFLDYREFSALNRWDQRGRFEVKQQQTERFSWFGHATAAVLPSTDLVELGGIPYRSTGAKTVDGRAGAEYLFGAHDKFSSAISYQEVSFDRPDAVGDVLRGGRIFETNDTWRHRINERLALGGNYSFRRALISGGIEPFDFHTTEAAIDYELSPLWSFKGSAGVVYLQETSGTPSRTGPAFSASLNRMRAGTTFHVGYLRTFIPSFGFGGTVEGQDVGVGFRTPLFHARRLYLSSSAIFRDNQPLTGIVVSADPATGVVEQLPLRSLRVHTILGWQPQPWARLEVFYSLVQQTSLHVGGYIDRNRVGFQIVTSKPMRMQ